MVRSEASTQPDQRGDRCKVQRFGANRVSRRWYWTSLVSVRLRADEEHRAKGTVSTAFKQHRRGWSGGEQLADEKGGSASAIKVGSMGIERPQTTGKRG